MDTDPDTLERQAADLEYRASALRTEADTLDTQAATLRDQAYQLQTQLDAAATAQAQADRELADTDIGPRHPII